jgi:hypothetical protein
LVACGRSDQATLELAPLSDLPPEIQQAPPKVRDAYRFALANQAILAHIPCYCGCGAQPHLHQNNAHCYIEQVRPDGTTVFDSHAFT